jgi:hypothetical protein
MSNPARGTGYSATVKLQLIVGDRTLELGQIGPDAVWLRENAEIDPCDATVVMTVDGRRHEWPVYLPDGLSRESREARTVARSAAPAASQR